MMAESSPTPKVVTRADRPWAKSACAMREKFNDLTLDSGVTISGVTSVELVAVADPFQASLLQVVKGDEVVVTRKTVDRANAALLQASKKVLGDSDGLLERIGADILRSHGGGDVIDSEVDGKERRGFVAGSEIGLYVFRLLDPTKTVNLRYEYNR